MKYRLIAAEKADIPVARACCVLGLSFLLFWRVPSLSRK